MSRSLTSFADTRREATLPWNSARPPRRFGRLPDAAYSHLPLLPRIWELQHNLSAYDAACVALAEALEASLVTRDARLAASSGHRARIELL
jgi:predicted nucleic acid-binding protein